jgi:hypothetical protein
MPSKSKQQQKFMGMVHALQKGDMKPSDASPELKKVAKSMDSKDAKDFASTSHKGLPKKVKQEIARKLREYANKMGTNTMGGDSIPSAKKGGLRDFDGYDNVDYNKDMPMDEGFKPEYKGNDDIIWKKGKTQKGVTNYIPYYKGHNIDNGGHNFKTEKELLSFIKDYIVSNQIYNKYRNESIKENFPSNWLQGRVSDYHTKKGTTPRDTYDKTNFNTKNSGQEDLEDEESVNESSDTLEMLQLLNKAMSTMPNSPKQKEIIKKLNVLRVKNKMKPLKEYGAISQGYHLEPSQEDKLDGTPEDKMAIDEVGVFPIRAFLDDMIPGNLIKTTNPKDKERLKSTIKDLIFTLNKFWQQHNIPYRVREK